MLTGMIRCGGIAVAAMAAVALASTGCSHENKHVLTASGLDPENFSAEYDGLPVRLYTLVNASGMEACITNFGGRIVSLMVPDRDGKLTDVVLGFDSIAPYFPENNHTDFGATIGRYANRIANGRIVVDGDTVQLPQNNFGHCLHGGPTGWQYKVFDASQPNDSTLVLSLVSPDGDNNFPGTVNASVTYTLRSDNALDIDYAATTDKKTVVNMTNHSYFNLNGDPSVPVTNHLLTIDAYSYTPVDSTFMTTGEIARALGTCMDFTAPRAIGEYIDSISYEQIKNAKGYDHNWVLQSAGDATVRGARVESPITGIVLEMYTSEPGVQVYTGNFLDGTITGKGGKIIPQRGAVCLESQKYPDTPNKPEWPSAWLNPGEKYTSHTTFRFSVSD